MSTSKVIDVHGTAIAVKFEDLVLDPNAVQIVIPTKLLDDSARLLVECCIGTIRKFTSQPYQIWLVDNTRDQRQTEWLQTIENVNLVLIETEGEGGSYENAVALEVAARLFPEGTKYMMTMHHDVVVTHPDWLPFLQGKITDKIKAAGVREDKVRVESGILHVLGYFFDFSLFFELGLTFMPELPDLDVGDRLIVQLKEAGYDYFACRNTMWEPQHIELLPPNSPFRQLAVDRAFDDAGNLIFMHLGRGVWKSTGAHVDPNKTNVQQWYEFLTQYVL